ncbi:MAG: NAD(+) kinase, partial [Pseudomonadota bacterium]|nr:NAD(+) kinase [Pseudomonadota bacterium]
PSIPKDELKKHCDLIIVVGGDGSLLGAARIAADQNLPVVGINRGTLGFLTDISPNRLEQLDAVLEGHYLSEERFLLEAQVHNDQGHQTPMTALNDVVLLPGDKAQMIVFDLYINEYFAYTMRADGLIVATPTGSTAYALSGGGPILFPGLNAIVLVPLCPHILSSRPLVITGDCQLRITICKTNVMTPEISCDGQRRLPVPIGTNITIKKHEHSFRLIHPINYNYYDTLRAKLHWKG